MKNEPLENTIITLHCEGWPIRRLSRELRISRKRIRRVLVSNQTQRDTTCRDSRQTHACRVRNTEIDKECLYDNRRSADQVYVDMGDTPEDLIGRNKHKPEQKSEYRCNSQRNQRCAQRNPEPAHQAGERLGKKFKNIQKLSSVILTETASTAAVNAVS